MMFLEFSTPDSGDPLFVDMDQVAAMAPDPGGRKTRLVFSGGFVLWVSGPVSTILERIAAREQGMLYREVDK